MNYLNYHTGLPRFHFEEGAAGGAAGAGGDAGAAAAAAAAASAAAAAAAAGAAKPWHDGVDAEFIGHAQNKGWKLDSPKEAFAAAAKVARDLEKHFGAPADQILRMPKADAKPEEIAAFRQKLGMPKEASEYDFSPVKDTTIADALRATAYDAGLSKDAAAKVASAVAKALESKGTTDSVVQAAKLAEDRLRLEVNWGGKDTAKFQFNMLQAMEGARRSGITPEAVKALETASGYDNVMEHFRKIGANTSEDTFVDRGSGNSGIATREGAMARKNELMSDPGWAKKFTAGDAEARREYDRLNLMIEGA